MARIRTIKPEYWTDAAVGECSVSARLLFIASWNFADDKGGLDRSAKQLKAQAFPYDVIDCEPLIQELLRQRLFVEYEAQGRKYLHINGFQKHQRIDKPTPPRIPLYEKSETLQESSTNPPRVLAPEGKGRERKRREEANPKIEKSRVAALATPDLDLESWARWETYRKDLGKPLRAASLEAAAKSLAGQGKNQAAVVEQSIANGWQGLFALKVDGKSLSSLNSGAVAAWEALLATDGAKRDNRVQQALDAVGGWSRIKERTTFEAPKIKAAFCAAYAGNS